MADTAQHLIGCRQVIRLERLLPERQGDSTEAALCLVDAEGDLAQLDWLWLDAP